MSTTDRGMSDATLSRALAKAFPRASTKRKGKQRLTYILGIQPTATLLEHSDTAGSEEHLNTAESEEHLKTAESEEEMVADQDAVQGLQDENQQLQCKNMELCERVQALESRIKALEQQQSVSMEPELHRQMYMVMHRGTCTVSGPDTPEHFSHFSLDAIATELQTHGPDLYKLFMELGDVRRTTEDEDDSVTVQTIKATTSLCTFLNARSRKVKGFQLLMGLMLIARATSRQV